MIGYFADIIFNVSSFRVLTFRDFKKDASARYSNHDVIGSKPKKEYTGPNLNGVSFTMDLHRSLGVNPESIESHFLNFVETGRISRFIRGGRNEGLFTINSISTSYDVIKNNGVVESAKIDLTLEEYF